MCCHLAAYSTQFYIKKVRSYFIPWFQVMLMILLMPSQSKSSLQPLTVTHTPNGFSITLPIDDITPVAETSLDNEALPTMILADTPATYRIVSSRTRKGSSLLTDSVSVTWICSYRDKKWYETVSQQIGTMNFKKRHH